MNPGEKENQINRQELGQPSEPVEAKASGEMGQRPEQLLQNYKTEKLRGVDTEANAVLHSENAKLEGVASLGYSPEQIAQLEASHGLTGQLEQNQRQVEQLDAETKSRIEAVTGAKNPEQAENKTEREKVIEQAQEKRGNMLTNFLTSEIASNGMDLVSFAGSGKMVVESISGKTLAGKKLTGKDRIIHGAIGAGSLLLDFTGIGEAKDLTIIAGKSLGLVEKAGVKLAERGALKSAKVFEVTAKFMAEHPQLVARAEQFAEAKIKEQIQNIKDYRKQAA